MEDAGKAVQFSGNATAPVLSRPSISGRIEARWSLDRPSIRCALRALRFQWRRTALKHAGRELDTLIPAQDEVVGRKSSRRPAAVAILVYLVAAALPVAFTMARNHGTFVYGLDDSYIHMAIAKNLVLHGVWGVNPYEWSNSSSSPAYTLLLAALFRVFGIRDLIPLAVNVVASALLIAKLNGVFGRRAPGLSNRARTAYLIAAVFILPLPAVTLLGMEHILHALLCVCLLDAFYDLLSSESPSPKTLGLFCALSAVAPLVRFETGFLLIPMFVALLARRRWTAALWMSLSVSVPMRILATVSSAHGAMPLPNSVLLKGALAESVGGLQYAHSLTWGEKLVHHLWVGSLYAPGLPVLAIVLALLVIRRLGPPHDARYVCVVVALIVIPIHLMLAGYTGSARYNLYVFAICLAVLAPFVNPKRGCVSRRARAVGLAAVLLLVGVPALNVPEYQLSAFVSSANISDQQYQMGLFLRQYYTGRSVAVNDIGAVDYLADIRTCDVVGLADNLLAKLRYADQLTPELRNAMIARRGVEIALVYDSWVQSAGHPPNWIRVASWTLAGNYVCGDATVTFYAASPKLARELALNVMDYAPRLPWTVTATLQVDPEAVPGR